MWGVGSTCPPGKSAIASRVCSWGFLAARIKPIHSRGEPPDSSTSSPLTMRTCNTSSGRTPAPHDQAHKPEGKLVLLPHPTRENVDQGGVGDWKYPNSFRALIKERRKRERWLIQLYPPRAAPGGFQHVPHPHRGSRTCSSERSGSAGERR